ncbi:amidase [Xylophilus sp.]|uniref:amidase n=1 Tax=Xylophilus sp. TaxID=2653893 RepID=UPI0013B8F58D|nr:amidase [Xylophilus sp.]KAF1050235.1 MAG: 2-amino-5-chloromuconic acid deaminase [Xylophilus sp.]
MTFSITELQTRLSRGETTSAALVDEALARAADPAGEGARVFTLQDPAAARAQAALSDAHRARHGARSPLEGLPVSIKDLFDVAGQVTRAGSRVLDGAAPAAANAAAVQRLLDAGAVPVGRTNMTEFAYSGVGINPHHGTPLGPWDRTTGRIPGGSSSGAAVSVSDRMAVAGLGTDTGGSLRIPAALCGLAGFKPTARRVPQRGTLALSRQLDSVGAMAPTVACCAAVDAVLSATAGRSLQPAALRGLSLATPTTLVLDRMDATVAAVHDRALARLSAAGATLHAVEVPEFLELAQINAQSGFTALEAYAARAGDIAAAPQQFDPRVLSRVLKGRNANLADLLALLARRQAWTEAVEERLAGFDAFVWPTVPVVAPPLAPLLASDELFGDTNLLLLRNPTLVNFVDGCALSIPCHEAGGAPVGLSVAALHGRDERLLSIGLAVEALLAPH